MLCLVALYVMLCSMLSNMEVVLVKICFGFGALTKDVTVQKTFLVRLSLSLPGCVVVSTVASNGRVKHLCMSERQLRNRRLEVYIHICPVLPCPAPTLPCPAQVVALCMLAVLACDLTNLQAFANVMCLLLRHLKSLYLCSMSAALSCFTSGIINWHTIDR